MSAVDAPRNGFGPLFQKAVLFKSGVCAFVNDVSKAVETPFRDSVFFPLAFFLGVKSCEQIPLVASTEILEPLVKKLISKSVEFWGLTI